jgi:hypothetical protein
MIYGNRKGVDLIIGYDDSRSQLFNMQASIAKLQTNMSSVQKDNVQLRKEMCSLKQASNGFRTIRSRFLDFFSAVIDWD